MRAVFAMLERAGTMARTQSAADCIDEGKTGTLTLEVTDDAGQLAPKTVAIRFYATPK